MQFKKIISLISAILPIFYGFWIPCVQATTPGDIQSHWAKRDIETALNLGIAGNYPDGTFEPDQMITRAEFIKILVNAGWVNPFPPNAQPTFRDVGRAHWAYPYVEAAVYSGIVPIEGNTGHFFGPDRPITRSEMATLVGRLMVVEHLPGVPATVDDQRINWSAVLKEKGIILGYPDGNLEENRGLTRAEACVVILRLKEQLLAAQTERERQWISSAQSNDGYITMSGGRQDIDPYFENLTEMAQLGQSEYLDGVKKYLQWALSNLNQPDIWGLNGTIYNYRLTNGVIQSVYSYDSADSYAATLLSLAAAYYHSSGDSKFILEHYQEFTTISEIITTLQDKDGLVWTKPNSQFKYLMDNCENYRGLKDWSSLLSSLGYKDQSELCDSKAELIRNGILKQLWDDNTTSFAWAMDNQGKKYLLSRGQSYPGVFAQIYPVTFGVIAPTSDKAILSYQKLNNELPNWAELEVGDPFPWAILGYAAVNMGDLARADRFLENCRSTYIFTDHKYPWSTFEDAFYIRACDALQKSICSDFN
ncbi:MAG TPA: S-layer homology domain-containing protein [Spirochaetia bacterium]|nr:S-layer homology domain-containing protein [Spirochaetia bacterium]